MKFEYQNPKLETNQNDQKSKHFVLKI